MSNPNVYSNKQYKIRNEEEHLSYIAMSDTGCDCLAGISVNGYIWDLLVVGKTSGYAIESGDIIELFDPKTSRYLTAYGTAVLASEKFSQSNNQTHWRVRIDGGSGYVRTDTRCYLESVAWSSGRLHLFDSNPFTLNLDEDDATGGHKQWYFEPLQ